MQVGLAADEHDLARAGRGELRDDLQRLVGGELVGARVAGARAAVGARLIARERQLPDHVGGVQRRVLRHLEPAQCHAFQIALDRDRASTIVYMNELMTCAGCGGFMASTAARLSPLRRAAGSEGGVAAWASSSVWPAPLRSA